MAHRTASGAAAPSSLSTTETTGRIGHFLPDDEHYRLQRAAKVVEFLNDVLPYCIDGQRPLTVHADQVAAICEWLEIDLLAVLDACRASTWGPA